MSKGTTWTEQDLLQRGLKSDARGIYKFVETPSPYLKDIVDTIKADCPKEVVILKGASVGRTQINIDQKIDLFLKFLDVMKLPAPVKEYRFYDGRRWRFDYAWPDMKIALEVEGGVFGHKKNDGTESKKGAHSSITGILRDIEKYNAATSKGWRILRCLPDRLCTMNTVNLLKTTIENL